MEENSNNLKVALLDQKVTDFTVVLSKLDAAIEKISEVNNNVSRMLAVHEERITKQEQVDTILFDKIDKLRDKMDSDNNMVTARIQLLERKLWSAIAILGVIVVGTNPNSLNVIKPLISEASSGTLDVVATFVNGSN
jgi:hypothetical protein